MSEPALVEFLTQLDGFSFLGIEYPLNSPDFGAVWDHFSKAGGYDMIERHRKKPFGMMVVFHNNDPEREMYFPGTIVEGMKEAPKGFTLRTFPAREFLVVTHEWLPTKDKALGQIFRISDYVKGKDGGKPEVRMPDGYARHDGPGSQVMLIERENFGVEDGNRYEFWIPIKKVD